MSSPIAYPTSPATNKRPAPHRAPKPRAASGFMIDDDDSGSESEASGEPAAKRRMLDSNSMSNESSVPAVFDLAGESQHTPLTNHDEEDDDPSSQLLHEITTTPARTVAITTTTTTTTEQQEQPSLLETLRERLFEAPETTLSPLESLARVKSGTYNLTTCDGTTLSIRERMSEDTTSYESIIAQRSKVKEGRARKAYYGIDIHALIDGAKAEISSAAKAKEENKGKEPEADEALDSVEDTTHCTQQGDKPRQTLLWTEKYRAKTFMDLCGDDTTNRLVLRWLKKWDSLVFPHAAKKVSAARRRRNINKNGEEEEEKPLRKILMLAGPPGLGKTTLAHVCARQAGYDVLEINASDDRSKDVVKGRIRTTLGTESVKNVTGGKSKGKPARPVCVVVDEVDGVVSGGGAGGEGGFVKALIDLITTDQRNSAAAAGGANGGATRRKKKGDDFRQMRPLVLICNDVYATALRPLRLSGLAEIIHVGKPGIESVVQRLKSVFEKEGIPCEKDAARRICEASWGMTSGLDAKKGAHSTTEGDLRGIMVVGEWVAGRLKAASRKEKGAGATPTLTRKWVEQNVLSGLSHGGGGARGIGRGGSKEIVARVFQDGAGFPKPLSLGKSTTNMMSVDEDGSAIHLSGPRSELPRTQLHFAEQQRKHAVQRLREMVDTSGEVDRVITELWTEWPGREFNDDSFLSKPNEAYDWLHFHDACSGRIFGGGGGGQEWELGPYLSVPVLAHHILFAGPIKRATQVSKWDREVEDPTTKSVFSGPRADFVARETRRGNRLSLAELQAQLSPTLGRAFRSPEDIATELLPWLVRLVSPDVKPVVVGNTGDAKGLASVRREREKNMVRRAADVLADTGIAMVRGKLEDTATGPGGRGATWVYRMDPDLDALASFETANAVPFLVGSAPTRYAVRQVLDQELVKTISARENEARMARFKQGGPETPVEVRMKDPEEEKENVRRELEKASVKRDFFGRVIAEPLREKRDANAGAGAGDGEGGGNGVKDEKPTIWVAFHEGINNAVKKPISLEELLRGL
ncbi:chromosome transmission fidelity protein 18 [Zalerion maritima]|uniref:Chromosome transmission fidelity protein 18 n=1 Tax=Zalerion maritima TaxID=339359 RepID=A0AAD5RYL0_9PEZI|nr:chromosome transmission fidelity protein 18 [Zalerion maritima]